MLVEILDAGANAEYRRLAVLRCSHLLQTLLTCDFPELLEVRSSEIPALDPLAALRGAEARTPDALPFFLPRLRAKNE